MPWVLRRGGPTLAAVRRWAFGILAVLGSLAAIGACAAWAVSERRIMGWRWSRLPAVTWTASSGDGQLDWQRTWREPLTGGQGTWCYVAPTGRQGLWLPGVAVGRTVVMRWQFRPGEMARGIPTPPSRMVYDSTVWDGHLAYGLAAGVGAAGPLAWAARRRRRRRRAADRAAGRCPGCGYDLRASPGRCPECGHLRAATDGSLARVNP